jgi:hypothetical protein
VGQGCPNSSKHGRRPSTRRLASWSANSSGCWTPNWLRWSAWPNSSASGRSWTPRRHASRPAAPAGRRRPAAAGTARHRDDWIAAGVFDRLADEAIASYDRIVGLDFSECSIDGCQHKAPAGGEGTGPSPVDRGKRGWIGWSTGGANHNDCTLVAPTLAATVQRVALGECQTLHLDRGDDNGVVRASWPTAASTTSSAPGSDSAARPPPRRPCRSACAGRSSAPTAGCPTSVGSAATPSGAPPPSRPASARHHPSTRRQTHGLARPMGPMNRLSAHAVSRWYRS